MEEGGMNDDTDPDLPEGFAIALLLLLALAPLAIVGVIAVWAVRA